MNTIEDYIFLVPCAGYGARMNSPIPKQYLIYKDKPIIYYTLQALSFFDMPIILIVAENDIFIKDYLNIIPNNVHIKYIGGDTRAQTVLNGLEYISQIYSNNPWVLVHDGARPLVNKIDVQNLIDRCTKQERGGLLATKVVDTLKKISSNKSISTLDRDSMYLAQTPQMFKLDVLYSALKIYTNVSDESSAVEQMGIIPIIIDSSRYNIKITTQEDLKWLQNIND